MKIKKLCVQVMALITILLAGLIPSNSIAAPSEKPTVSLMTSEHANTLGVFADTQDGVKTCWDAVTAGTVRFYNPTDLHGFDPNARTVPLEATTCARMRVRGGVIGIVALRQGSLMNLGMRDGREQPVAFNKCNNWTELLPRPNVRAVDVTTQTVTTKPQQVASQVGTTTEQVVTNTVIVRRVTVVRYVDETRYEPAPTQRVNIGQPTYTFTQVEERRLNPQSNCINGCYAGANPRSEHIVQCRYPSGETWCVLSSDCRGDRPPAHVRSEYQSRRGR